MKRKLHVLDFTAPDVEDAIRKLEGLQRSHRIQGLMFVVKTSGNKRPMVGAAGCCISDPIASIGAAGYLYAAVIDSQFNK